MTRSTLECLPVWHYVGGEPTVMFLDTALVSGVAGEISIEALAKQVSQLVNPTFFLTDFLEGPAKEYIPEEIDTLCAPTKIIEFKSPNIALNGLKREVKINGNVVENCSSQVFDTLWFLSNSPNKVLSKSTILRGILGDIEYTDRYVDYLMSKARRFLIKNEVDRKVIGCSVKNGYIFNAS